MLLILTVLFSLSLGILVLPVSALDQNSTEAKPPRPNVLFIAIDDLNDWVGCLQGHPNATTPNINALAKRGTLFSNAHCQAPLCNSSRTSVMTGLRPSTTGIYGLAPWFRNVDEFKELISLPQAFSKAGYRTYSAGKLYHGGYGRKKTDREFDLLGPAASVGAKPDKKLVNTPSKHPLVDWGPFPHRDEEKGDWLVTDWAVNQLSAEIEEPFFLSVGFFLPHVPCYATQKWFDLYPPNELQTPPIKLDDRDDTPRFSWYLHWQLPEPRLKFLNENNQFKNLTRSYLACTSFVDGQVGRILSALESSGKLEKTIVVLWSDHGFHLGEKLITGKNTLWERSTHVPLIFAGPGIAVGANCEQPVELLDIYPTLVELCGLSKNNNLEGRSLSAQLKDPAASRQSPAITTHNQGNHSVRSRHWRYIVYADGSQELYDTVNDPHEWSNLADQTEFQEIIAEHRKWLPKLNRKPAVGSKHRILTYQNGQAVWQGNPIGNDDPIPEID